MTFQTSNLAIIARNPLTRLGLTQFIQDLYLDYQCVLAAPSLLEIREKLMRAAVTTLVVEIEGAQEDERSLVKQLLLLCQHCPMLNIIVYTACRDIGILSLLQSQKSISLIAKHEPQEQLCQNFSLALVNGKVCSSTIKRCLQQEQRPSPSYFKNLTPSERNVLKHLLAGLSLTDIAALCHRSIKTISAHKCNSMRKLGISHASELFQLPQSDVFL